jgi:hypothetical protein
MAPRVNAYITLHYGLEYLAWVIRSLYPFVERICIVYAPQPSHGQHTRLKCPDSAHDLWRAALAADLDGKVEWTEGEWRNEGMHRDAALAIASVDADIVVVADADEVWHPEGLEQAIRQAVELGQARYRVPMVHLWRSFRWACSDAMMPIRVFNLAGRGENAMPGILPIAHFGYAQNPETVRYKESIHGHKNEWRNGWFERKFLAWQPGNGVEDVHPTCENIWTPSRYNPASLPAIMRAHPYYGKELIE